MAGFENLIKNAIGSQNAEGDPAARERIYRSSRVALNRMLTTNTTVDPSTAVAQRKRLEDAIATIEAEFAAGADGDAATAQAPAGLAPAGPDGPAEPVPAAPDRTPDPTPEPTSEPTPEPVNEPATEPGPGTAAEPVPEPQATPMPDAPDAPEVAEVPEVPNVNVETSANTPPHTDAPAETYQTAAAVSAPSGISSPPSTGEPSIEVSPPATPDEPVAARTSQVREHSALPEDAPPESTQQTAPPVASPEPSLDAPQPAAQTPTARPDAPPKPPPVATPGEPVSGPVPSRDPYPPTQPAATRQPPVGSEPAATPSAPPVTPPPARPVTQENVQPAAPVSPPVPSRATPTAPPQNAQPAPPPATPPAPPQVQPTAEPRPTPVAAQAAPIVETSAPISQETGPISQPVAAPQQFSAQRREPALEVPVAKPDAAAKGDGFAASRGQPPAPKSGVEAIPKKRPYIKMLAWVIIICGLGTAAWWAWTFGPELLRNQIEQSVANPEDPITRGPFTPNDGEGWISVFDPATDPRSIVTDNRGTAELVQVDDGTIARLRSASAGAEGNILIRIPPGVVEQMRGKAVTFEIVVAAPADGDQQVAIYCEFDVLGSCGRKRFEVGRDPTSHIFDVLAEDISLPADRGAFIAINTDILGQRRSVDVSAIRMRLGE